MRGYLLNIWVVSCLYGMDFLTLSRKGLMFEGNPSGGLMECIHIDVKRLYIYHETTNL